MNIHQKTETTIVLTSEDVQNIVKEYLETKGYKIDEIYPQTKTVYTDHMDSYGSVEFSGFRIKANTLDGKKILN